MKNTEKQLLDVTEYGAAADGVSLCTNAIQRAIDLCPKGGTVYLPAGTFVSGALFLKSNMTLFLEEGARLLGSDNAEDFPIVGGQFEGYNQLCHASLLNTEGAPHENITIAGKGVIDANGESLFQKEMAENKGRRGRAIFIRNTRNLTIKDCTIRQSPAWCLHLLYCSDVLLDGIQIHTKYDETGKRYADIFNGDGIDIDACQNVKIVNSMIASQDDCIAIKSGRDVAGRRAGVPSENILIENCAFKYGFGVAMGSEMSGGINNVAVKNCTFEDTFSIASIKAVRGRGAYVKNVHYENCSMTNRDCETKASKWFRGAIYMDGFYGKEACEFDADALCEINEATPVVENILLENLTLDTAEGYAIYLCGLPEMPYKNVTLKNIRAKGPMGFFQKNMENLQLSNVEVNGLKL